jgi:diguanylate cyclase (GGDEF)-like protein
MIKLRKALSNLIYPEGVRERRNFQRLSEIDPLTGLGNRRAFDRAINNLDNESVIILFDLNNLGLVNKLKGHEEGDKRIIWAAEVISTISNAIMGQNRSFRLGGDEFAVIGKESKAQNLIDSVEDLHDVIDYKNFRVSIAGTYGLTFKEADSLLQNHKQYIKDIYLKAI